MKKILPLFLMVSLFYKAQTIFNTGDLIIVGFANNISSCDENNSTYDIAYLASAQDISAGTTMDITDNGWEREFPNYWGTTEGIYRLTYSGNTIPAGEVFPIVFTTSNASMIEENPDWNFENLGAGIAKINFSLSGDQLFFMQGGEWSFGAETHQGSYNGRLIYAFNNTNDWQSDNNTTTSNLPSVLNCASTFVPVNGASYLYYSGNNSDVPMQEWLQRSNERDNWTVSDYCQQVQNSHLNNLNISSSDILISPNTQIICPEFLPIQLQILSNFQDITYQWFESDTPSINDGVAISNQNQPIYTPSVQNAGTKYYYCQIQVNGCILNSSLSSVKISTFPRTSNINPN